MNRNYLPEVFFMISRKTDKFTGFVLDGENIHQIECFTLFLKG